MSELTKGNKMVTNHVFKVCICNITEEHYMIIFGD